ncbi:MAG: hypothetical protein WCC74_00995 [Minisyncoccia bacterium]
MLKINFKKDKLHHAYCINASGKDIMEDFLDFLEKEIGFKTKGNPDFWFAEFNTLNVEESRKIKETHFQKPTVGNLRVSVICTNFITEQAQNAMLKMFEEPSGGTCFFLISPSVRNLLPTLRSRMILIDIEKNEKIQNKADKNSLGVKEFLSDSIAERLKKIKKLLDNISDEKDISDREGKIQAINFLNHLETEVYKQINIGKATKHELFILEEIEKSRSYASDPSSSLKILLEHLALVI